MGQLGGKTTFAQAIKAAKPLVKRERICMDGTLVDEFQQVLAEHERARQRDENSNDAPEAPALLARLEELRDKIEAAQVEFVFQSMGRTAWRQLVTEHPPTKAQQDKQFADFNLDTFPVAAMAVCCVEPEGATVEGFEELAKTLNQGQWDLLWATCHQANMGEGAVPNFVAASGTARPSEAS